MPKKAYDFQLLIDGVDIGDRAKLHLGSISYQESLTETAELEFVIRDSESFRLDNSHVGQRKGYKFSEIGLGSCVEFSLGFVHDLTPLFTGEVIELSPQFSSEDPAGLRVIAQDLSYQFKRVPEPREFTNATAKGIAEEIVAAHGLELLAHPVEPLSGYKHQDDQSYTQRDETDWEVLEMVSRVGKYNLLVKHEYVVMADDDYLAGAEYHAKMDKDHPHKQLTLIFNATRKDLDAIDTRPLATFRPQVGSAEQREKVEIIGWTPSGSSGETKARTALDGGKDQVYTDIKVRTQTTETVRIHGVRLPSNVEAQWQARALVEAELDRRARNLVRGDAVLATGEPYLRVGQRHIIQINDLRPFGAKFSGEYTVTAVRHEIDEQGVCRTEFDVRRPEVTKV